LQGFGVFVGGFYKNNSKLTRLVIAAFDASCQRFTVSLVFSVKYLYYHINSKVSFFFCTSFTEI